MRQNLDPENPDALWDWAAVGLPSSYCSGTHKNIGVIIDTNGEERRPIFCANCGVLAGTARNWPNLIYFCDKCDEHGADLLFPECAPAFVQYLDFKKAEQQRAG